MKHTAQQKSTNTEMMKDMTMEMDTETMTTKPLPDQDPMVSSLIRSRRLGLADKDWVKMATVMRKHHTIYPYVTHYIYPIKTLLKMLHALLYAKFGFLDWCCCHI